MDMRIIALEEHFATPAFLDGPGRLLRDRARQFGGPAADLLARLCDIGDQRIAEMDAAGVDVQVLSLTAPGTEQLHAEEAVTLARNVNEFLIERVNQRSTRFAAFASLPTAAPEEASKELERVAKLPGFKGALINGHHQGRYLDDVFFRPIFEAADSLAVPLYLHPTDPPQPVIDACYAGFAPIVTTMFASAAWGWHVDAAIHVLRLILGGVFDRFPSLQIIVGHLGETLPFMIRRLDVMPIALTALKRPVSAYLKENLHYTISGFNFASTFQLVATEIGVDRMMFSTDYPYASMSDATNFLNALPIDPLDREKIACKNAERLLGV
jgi:uncharacterized protein